jgi:hypothetical protein
MSSAAFLSVSGILSASKSGLDARILAAARKIGSPCKM